MKIAASLLSADFNNLESEISRIEHAGIDFWHLDVMDGVFVPNFTFGVSVIDQIKTTKPLQVHFMVEKPQQLYELFSKALFAQVNQCEFIFHVENTNVDLTSLLNKVHSDGFSVGLAVNPSTIASQLDPYLQIVDSVLIMSVNPGFSGQKFISGVLGKIDYIKSINSDVKIGLDGGVSLESLSSVNMKNVDFLVSGSYLFASSNASQAVLDLRALDS